MYPYISITDQEIEEMLKTIGISSTDELYSDIPENVQFKGELNIPKAKSEVEVRRYFDEIFAKNTSTDDKVCFLGGGAYDRYVPSVIPAMASRSEFYTSYTPYQPEISQGTLSYIFEYQTMMANLTGMPISNASLYDGGTAITEAALMTIQKSKKSKILCADTVSPSAKEILLTYCHDRKVEVEFIPMKDLL
ncbi:MAG: glycine dehydrogenase, partial [Finegoldia magna]